MPTQPTLLGSVVAVRAQGGADHVVGACAFGTDCGDCGVRCLPLITGGGGGETALPSLPPPSPPFPPLDPAPPVWPIVSRASPSTPPPSDDDVDAGCVCLDQCAGRPDLNHNGECNDGGAINLAGGRHAVDAQCALGTDCADCGLRCPFLFTTPSPPPSPLPAAPESSQAQRGDAPSAQGESTFGFHSQVAVAVAASVATSAICLVLLAISLRRRWPRRSQRLRSAYIVGGTELSGERSRRRPFGGRVVQAKVLAVERAERSIGAYSDGDRRLSGAERTPPRTPTLGATPASCHSMSPAEMVVLRKENALLRELFLVNHAAPKSSMLPELGPSTSLAEEQQGLVVDGDDLDLSRV